MNITISTQPETYSQLLSRSWALYQVAFSRVLLLAVLLVAFAFFPRFLSVFTGEAIFTLFPINSLKRFWLLFFDLLAITCFTAMIWRMHCIILKKHEPYQEDFYVGLRKLFPIFAAALIQGMVVLLMGLAVLELEKWFIVRPFTLENKLFLYFLFLAQGLLIIYIYLFCYFYFPLIAIENKGIIASLLRSVFLVWHNLWRTLSVQVTPWLCYLALLLLIRSSLGVNIHIYFLETGIPTWWLVLIQAILFTVFIPWVAATLLVQLHDLELRKHVA